MARNEPWRAADPEPDRQVGALPYGERRRAPGGRFEVTVWRRGATWGVSAGRGGVEGLYASHLVALKQARELARVRWAETGTLTCVKTLNPEGTWEIEQIYGIDRRRP